MWNIPVLGAREEPSVQGKEEQSAKHLKSGPDEDKNIKDKYGRRDENTRFKTSESGYTASSGSEAPQPAGQPMDPEPSRPAPHPPKGSAHRGSASARRALFARRRLDASASPTSSGGPSPPGTPSLTPQRRLSPPRSQSPGSHQRPTPPSSPSPSTSTLRPVSPFRGLSPTRVQSHGSPVESYAQCHGRLPPRDQLSTGRPVSHFSFFIFISKEWHHTSAHLPQCNPAIVFFLPESFFFVCFF